MGTTSTKRLVNLVGKVIRDKAEIILIFRVDTKYYPATDENSALFETYLHTGNETLLSKLTNELEL